MSAPRNLLRDNVENWKIYGNGLGSDYTDCIQVIEGAYKVEPIGLNPLSEKEFPCLTDPEKIRSVIQTMNKLLDAKKLLGPYKPNSIEVSNFVTFFLVEKSGSLDEIGNPTGDVATQFKVMSIHPE